MMKKVFLIFAFVLFILPVVMAIEITVRTSANMNVAVTLINPGNGDSGGFYENVTDTGTWVGNIDTGLSTADINVIIRDAEGHIVSMKKFPGYSMSQAQITLDMLPVPIPTPVVNNSNTVLNTTPTTAVNNTPEVVVAAPETADTNKSISGFSVFQNIGDKINMTVVYYTLGIILLLVVVFLGFKFRGSFGRLFKKEADYFPKLSHSHAHVNNDDKGMRVAESRLKRAQEEFERAKKIREAEKKVSEAKRDLDRTRRGM